MKNYYDLLSLPANAPGDEIKKAFRREIARYHPDKVQHLGKEFQEMAAGMAADLTEAYRILMDPSLRAKYDDDLRGGGAPSVAHKPSPAATSAPPRPEAAHSAPPPPAAPSGPGARPTAGIDFVKRATMSKMRDAIEDVLVNATPLIVTGFDIALATKPKKGLFKKAEDALCLLVKFVPQVDAGAITEIWPAAARVKVPDVAGCVLLLIGSGMSSAKDLSAAVTEQRRKTRGAGPVLVPVDVRDWEALFPPETPTAVRAILQRLKDEKR
ncbi:MAG TPA: J domain-containing protein [Vicinamibacterales bacterium]|nr:J domain-containing protein [Vicinamibacterales bacterium]